MLGPTGLDRFAERFPDRTYDVGIAEQHAATSAAGMAYGGLHPVVALYATFLNRAFDQVLMDCALHRAGVTFVLDRAGVTGDDGASHNGMWDMAMLQIVPGLRIAAPRDEATLRAELREAVAVADAPDRRALPEGRPRAGHPGAARRGRLRRARRVRQPRRRDRRVGAFAPLCIDVAERLQGAGHRRRSSSTRAGSSRCRSRWCRWRPRRDWWSWSRTASAPAASASAVSQLLRDSDVEVPVRNIGVPERFLDHGKRAEVLAACGLTAQDISRSIVETMADGRSRRTATAGVDRTSDPSTPDPSAQAPSSQSTT